MSSVYSTEPAPSGKVVIKTTLGDLEVELFAKETPKACRNFIQLALEGYYEGCLFHRVVPGFIVQTGDPTNTGEGGESIYGQPFADEIHSRLRFNRRGLLGMATTKSNENQSQFFFTLDKAEELTRKHTMFGRIVGDTVFNLLRIGDVDLDKDERPVHPVKILAIEVLNNPFDDIVPRTTALERRAEEEERLQAERRKKEAEDRKRTAKISKKNVNLLSFEEDEAPELVPKIKSAHDAVDDGRLSRQTVPEAVGRASKGKDKPDSDEDDDSDDDNDSDSDDADALRKKRNDVKEEHAKRERAAREERRSDSKQETVQDIKDDRLRKLETEIANVESSLKSKSGKGSADTKPAAPKKPLSFVEEQRALYLSSKKGVPGKKEKRKIDESDILAQLQSFTKRIRTTADPEATATKAPAEKPADDGEEENRCRLHNRPNCESCKRVEALGEEGDDYKGDEEGWLGHALVFDKETGVRDVFKPEDYEVLDPRADR